MLGSFVCVMECMCAQTRPRSILSAESYWGRESETMLTSREKIPSTGGSEEYVYNGKAELSPQNIINSNYL